MEAFAEPLNRPRRDLGSPSPTCYDAFALRIKMGSHGMFQNNQEIPPFTRRTLIKGMGLAPLFLRPAPLFGAWFGSGSESGLRSRFGNDTPAAAAAAFESFSISEPPFRPHYPAKSPLADVLSLIEPGSDDYTTEKQAAEIEAILKKWGDALRVSATDLTQLADLLDPGLQATSMSASKDTPLRSGFGVEVVRKHFDPRPVAGKAEFVRGIQAWLHTLAVVEVAEFEIFAIEELTPDPETVRTTIRYDLVGSQGDRREERVGSWQIEWRHNRPGAWKASRWELGDETVSSLRGPAFLDVTGFALGGTPTYSQQLHYGADYWRTILDGAIGVDVYGNNGIAIGDFDGDGWDDLYVCQPAGLPNRLYRNLGDGSFEDVTEKAGVGVLDNTASALFADFSNRGRQDLLVICAAGPSLFVNRGDGTFAISPHAFKFAKPPQGSFTHAALADYDGDGWLDIYFCTYSYYLGLDQYHYPVPYYDARNGPPNCLFRNQGDGTFVETTTEAGMDAENNRYSFACAWGKITPDGLPDLFIANDFGSSQLYRNDGKGHFTVASREAGVEGVGAGMGACWTDYDNDGRQDIYITSMWEAAGQRVTSQPHFHPGAREEIRELYRRHARGNALYHNSGDGTFQNRGRQAGVEMGRWSWSADSWDFDHDGYTDLYIANGYISAPDTPDRASFFWRQVVAKSPEDNSPSLAYEQGWQAMNEIIRSDQTWNGYARNVFYANNRDGSFSEASGPVGLDCIEDSRSFALADLDGDGRQEVILKNRNAPQVRVLHNAMNGIGTSVAIHLRGHHSNWDAIGAAVTVTAGTLRQTKYLQAGTGFLAQHSKDLFFGLGAYNDKVSVTILWPRGLQQSFEAVPVQHRIQFEEGNNTFVAHPFSRTAIGYQQASIPAKPEPLPNNTWTWLAQPLKAPDFTLLSRDGSKKQLSAYRGRNLLLTFFSADSPTSLAHLEALQKSTKSFLQTHLDVLAIQMDMESTDLSQDLAHQAGITFPILLATEQTAGLYNLIYRYLFDRRRDLPLPVSFLLDKVGLIQAIQQGSVDPDLLRSNLMILAGNPQEYHKRALPFPGILIQSDFSRNDFSYGVAMFQHGYLNEAADSFQQVINGKPENAEAYYNLGTLGLARNDLPQAQQYLEKAVGLRPDYPEAWNNLGILAARAGNLDPAATFFQRALTLRPGYATALLNLGNVYRRQGKQQEAMDTLEKALLYQPLDPETAYSLGMLYAQLNDLTKATQLLLRAVHLRPAYPEAMNNLGVIYVRGAQYAQAEEQFKSCMQRAPAFDQSYINLARLYALQKDKVKAREVLLELQRKEPDNAHAVQALESLEAMP